MYSGEDSSNHKTLSQVVGCLGNRNQKPLFLRVLNAKRPRGPRGGKSQERKSTFHTRLENVTTNSLMRQASVKFCSGGITLGGMPELAMLSTDARVRAPLRLVGPCRILNTNDLATMLLSIGHVEKTWARAAVTTPPAYNSKSKEHL